MPLTIPHQALKPLVTAIASMANPSPVEATRYAFISTADSKLIIKATDGYNWLVLSAECEGTIDPIQIDATVLKSVIGPMRGSTFKLEVTAGKLKISSKEGGQRTIAGVAVPYPQPPEISGTKITLETARLREAIAFTKDSASDDLHKKPHLCGVHLHSVEGEYKAAAAYAAGCSAITVGEGSEDFAVTIANPTVKHLSLITSDSVTLTIGERMVQFDWEGGSLRGSRIILDFVDYRRSIPSHCNYLSVRPSEMNECMNAIAPVATADFTAKSQIIRLKLGERVSFIGAVDSDEQPADAEWSGPDMVIGFISKRMKAALEGFGDDELRIEIGEPNQPICVRSVRRDDRVSILMPVTV